MLEQLAVGIVYNTVFVHICCRLAHCNVNAGSRCRIVRNLAQQNNVRDINLTVCIDITLHDRSLDPFKIKAILTDRIVESAVSITSGRRSGRPFDDIFSVAGIAVCIDQLITADLSDEDTVLAQIHALVTVSYTEMIAEAARRGWCRHLYVYDDEAYPQNASLASRGFEKVDDLESFSVADRAEDWLRPDAEQLSFL